MEYMPGGDLLTRLQQGGQTIKICETECYFKQLLLGVSYIHNMGIAHRDLKPENLMLDERKSVLKIADFGSAEVFQAPFDKATTRLRGVVGSQPYIAPEEWTCSEFDGPAVDAWACGVILHVLLERALPWYSARSTDKQYAEYVRRRWQTETHAGGYRRFDMHEEWAVRVLYGVLEPMPAQRWDVGRVLSEPWMRGIADMSLTNTEVTSDKINDAKLILQPPGPALSLFQILVLRAVPWRMLLQRLPGVLIVFVVVLGLLGPAYAPFFYASYLLAIHLLSANAAIRIAYGSKVAVAQAVRHSTTDWSALYCSITGSAHTADLSHDLPFDDVDHVIIIPGFKESEDTWCETLDVLASHSRAVSHYKVCLAMEQADDKAEQMAMMLVSRYIDCFLQVVYTIHPKGLEGETAGKHSNVSWAARQMTRKSKSVKSDIITVMDCDTAFAEDYFLAITCHFASSRKQDRMLQMFAPSTVFDRNADEVPVFVRLADMIWSAGVMGNYVPFSPISIPCSAYSLPMELAQAVDFWDVGSEGLGEDMHMFLKIFFATEGRIRVIPIYSPASCCNIEGKKGSGVLGAMRARYGQAKRHLWGCLDSGYALRKALFTVVAPGYDNVIIGRLPASASKTADGKKKPSVGSLAIATDEVHFNLYKLVVLFHRLAEAHIIGGHLTILLIMSALLPLGPNPSSFSQRFWSALTTHGIHPVVVLASDVCGYIRLVSLLSVVALAVYYERYHAWVGALRWQYSAAAAAEGVGAVITTERDARLFGIHVGPGKRVQHLGRRPGLQSLRSVGVRRWRVYFDWCALPITALLYQSIPQFHAQLLQLWTDALVYETAAKPDLKRAPGSSALQQAEEASGIVHVYGGHERMPGEVVDIPALDMDDVETLVNSRSGVSSTSGGPDEILVLQGLKAHRIGVSQTPPPPSLTVKQPPNGPMHSHTNSFSNFNEFETASTIMSLPSFPASPRLVGAYVQQPPPPYVQAQRSPSGANSPPVKSVAQYFESAPLAEKERVDVVVGGWADGDIAFVGAR
ncbi:hypothetical protein HDU83_005309 [Entophlyctis luteolus]|nr:hypothetical protein HDU83_005309 [Entophlyctis luteolus]